METGRIEFIIVLWLYYICENNKGYKKITNFKIE
jgi:hypothetical protein